MWAKPLVNYSKKNNIVDEILDARGVDDIDDFLSLSTRKFHDPYKMKDMREAVERIKKAVEANETIGILGDYDADGVTSTSLWLLVLSELNANLVYFVPDRTIDGYGVGRRSVDFMYDNDVTLVITCDTGITAIEYTDEMMSRGVDVIITDHHEPQPVSNYPEPIRNTGVIVDEYLIPKCIAVVNMKRPDCDYPFKELAGVGVSFKILCALSDEMHPLKQKLAHKYLELVAIGTVADMMQVVDENRVFVSKGLDFMNGKPIRGVKSLLSATGLSSNPVTSRDIGWTLAPTINAAGRIVSADQAVDMMVTSNQLDAYRYASELSKVNTKRKEMTSTYVDSIIKKIAEDDNDEMIIISYIPQIPEGIIGLVAGRVMNHFNKPCIVLSDSHDDTYIKGSGRSIDGLNLFMTLMDFTDIINFGGHAAACGLSLKKSDFDSFRARLELSVSTKITERDLVKEQRVDVLINGKDIDTKLVDALKELEPFGRGNEQPVFMVENAFILKEKPVGDQKNHLWGLVKAGGQTFGMIGFFLEDEYDKMGRPKKVDILFHPDINEYPKGKFNVQMKVIAIRGV